MCNLYVHEKTNLNENTHNFRESIIASALYVFNSTKFKAHLDLKTVGVTAMAALVLKGNFNMLIQLKDTHMI